MTTARFGRMRVGKCIGGGEQSAALEEALQKVDPNSLGCYADVLAYTDRMCSGKTTCDIAVPNHDLLSTRPCLSQLTMYLEAAFHCVSGKSSQLLLRILLCTILVDVSLIEQKLLYCYIINLIQILHPDNVVKLNMPYYQCSTVSR